MPEITPDELDDRLAAETNDVFVLDIRPRDEYEEWHIPGSDNIPVYEALNENPEAADKALSSVPHDTEIVTVCAAGVLSQKATERLREIGYDAKTLVDGMNGWSRVHRSAPIEIGIDGTLVQVARPGKGCLSHVLISNGEAAVFDPSQYVSEYDAVLAEHDADLVGVFDTHAHADHVSGGYRLAGRHGVPYHLHPEDDGQIEPAGYLNDPLDGFAANLPQEPLTAAQITAIGDRGFIPEAIPFTRHKSTDRYVSFVLGFDEPIENRRLFAAYGYNPETNTWEVAHSLDVTDIDRDDEAVFETLAEHITTWITDHYELSELAIDEEDVS